MGWKLGTQQTLPLLHPVTDWKLSSNNPFLSQDVFVGIPSVMGN